jgi:C-terminal processing protease CtpA/Prc
MKKITFSILVLLTIVGCSSIKNHNVHLDDLISEDKLKADTDFIYKKLQNLHPKLYWYISKKDLDFKFDSLKTTLNKSMTSYDFYKKIAPVISEVRQGHMSIFANQKQYTKSETKKLMAKGIGPFSQFDFEILNDKMYVVKNKSYNKKIKVGTEVVAINGKMTADIIKNINPLFTSDGYNKTFKNKALTRMLPAFITNEIGMLDSINYDFKFNDSLSKVSIKRKVIDSAGTKLKKVKVKFTAFQKAKKKADAKKKDILGYDETTKLNMRNLKFMEKDSSIAIIKINGFRNGNYSKFYEQSFSKIDYNNSKTLILDLRNNGGGRLEEIATLYSYLSDSTFVFLDKSEVATKNSLFKAAYFRGGSVSVKTLKVLFTPIVFPLLSILVKKEEEKYFVSMNSKPRKIKKDVFKGKVYVLINGGSFSASSIISSNLKGSKRATFVGEETGGAFNGTVAGRMPLIPLPHSKLKVRVGLLACIPKYKTDIEGRGIFPDKEIIPTLQDRINGNDPEMNWILDDIKKTKTVISEIQKQ